MLPGGKIEIFDRSDPAAVLDDLKGMPLSSARDQAIAEWIKGVAMNGDPALARKWWVECADLRAEARAGLAAWLARTLATSRPEDAVEFIEKDVPASMRGLAWAGWLGNVPPEEASRWLERMPEGGVKQDVWSRTVASWMRQDPARCVEWLDRSLAGYPQGAIKLMAKQAVGGAGDSADMEGSLAGWRSAYDAARTPEARNFFAEVLFQQVQGEDEAVRQRVLADIGASLPEDPDREIFSRALDLDPAGAVGSLSAEEVAALDDNRIRSLAGLWIQKDAARGVAWLLESGRLKVLPDVIGSWYERDPSSVRTYAEALPAGEKRDAMWAAVSYRELMQGDGAKARSYAANIGDPNERGKQLLAIERQLETWRERDKR